MKTRAKNIDPVVPLLSLQKLQHAAWITACEANILSDDEAHKLSDVATKTWWKMLDTSPTTPAGAMAVARWVAELEAKNLAPNMRKGQEQNPILTAMNGLLAFFDDSAEDPTIQQAQRVERAFDAWFALPPLPFGKEHLQEPYQDEFNVAWKILLKARPHSLGGIVAIASVAARVMAEDSFVDQECAVAVLSNIGQFLSGPRTNSAEQPVQHSLAAE